MTVQNFVRNQRRLARKADLNLPQNCRGRESGQGLILAVLVLILIALFGAAFIAVVASNMNSAGSDNDRGEARVAAQRGREFANLQLVKSHQGLDWRPQTPRSYAPVTRGRLVTITGIQPTDPPTRYVSGAVDQDFYTYYDQFEQLRNFTSFFNDTNNFVGATPPYGWVRRFVKYPDPLNVLAGLESSDKAPCLLEVKYPALIGGLPKPILEVHTVGRSRTSSATFHELRAYKPVMLFEHRTITNYDHGRKVVPSTTLVTVVNANVIDVNPAPGFELTPDRYVGQNKYIAVYSTTRPLAAPNVEIRMVVLAGPSPVAGLLRLTLDFPFSFLPPTIPAGDPRVHQSGERVETAVSLGQPTRAGFRPAGYAGFPGYPNAAAADFDGNSANLGAPAATSLTNELNHVNELVAPNPFNTVHGSEHVISDVTGGVFANGSLLLHGFNIFRIDTNASNQPLYQVRSSGLIAMDELVGGNPLDPNHPAVSGVAVPRGAVPARVVDSSNVNFPTQTSPVLASIVNDGWDTVRNVSSSANRQVHSITPPDYDDGVLRYRKMTQLATVPGMPASSSLYGWGQGIYINNPQDIEPLPGRLVSVQAYLEELKDLWMKRSLTSTRPGQPNAAGGPENWSFEAIGTVFHRNTVGQAGALNDVVPPPAGQLELRHLRGWITDNEFVPRGVHIDLIPNMNALIAASGNDPGMIITMDELSDADTTGYDPSTMGPDLRKTWKDPMTGASMGTYSLIIQYANLGTIQVPVYVARTYLPPVAPANVGTWSPLRPFNRVIFAEGNIRIRGTLADGSTPLADLMISLTIVSGGSIYIEGDLRAPQVGMPRSVPPAAPATIQAPDYVNNPPLGRIALLANYHVTVNPTQFVPRVHGVTQVVPAAVASTNTVNVRNGIGLGFNVNDVVLVWQTVPGLPTMARVTGGNARTLVLDRNVPSASSVQIASHPSWGLPDDDLTIPAFYKVRKDVSGRSFEPMGERYAVRARQVVLQDSFDGLSTITGHPRLDYANNGASLNQIRLAVQHGAGAQAFPTNGGAAYTADPRMSALSVQYTKAGAGPNSTTFQLKLDDRQAAPGTPGFPEQHRDIYVEANSGAAAPYLGKWMYDSAGNVAVYLDPAVAAGKDLNSLVASLTPVGYNATRNPSLLSTILGLNLAAFTNVISPAAQALTTQTGRAADPTNVPITIPLATAIRLYLNQPTALNTSILDDPINPTYVVPDFVIGANRHTLTSVQGTNDFIVSVDDKFYRIAYYDAAAGGTWIEDQLHAPWYVNEGFPSFFGNGGTIAVAGLPLSTRPVLAFDENPAGSPNWRPNAYRLSRSKVEGFHFPGTVGTGDPVQARILQAGGIAGNAPTPAIAGTAPAVPVAGATIEINAIVYAQQGSWFVIPGSYYDNTMWSAPIPGAGLASGATTLTLTVDPLNRVRVPLGSWIVVGSQQGIPPDSETSEGRFVVGVIQQAPGVAGVVTVTLDHPLTSPHTLGLPNQSRMIDVNLDANRDGFVTTNERFAMIRFLRNNYSITFRGSIAENHTATNVVDASGEVGDVRDWTDKWTFPVSNLSPLANAAPFFRSIRYTYDVTMGPNMGGGALQIGVIPPSLPASPDLIEASG